MKLGFIGAGEMGGSIIKGLTVVGSVPQPDIVASVRSESSAKKVRAELGIQVFTENQMVIEKADVIFLGVKPSAAEEVMSEIKKMASHDKLVVSMVLGQTTEKMQKALPGFSVVRIMPNTPVAVGKGMTLLCPGKETSAQQLETVQAIFDRIGKTLVIDEKLMEAGSSVSGSGPAFMYLVIAGLAKAAEEHGFNPAQAARLAAQTALGSAEMVLYTGKEPEELAQEVATPGGSTEQGMQSLKAARLEEVLVNGVNASIKKAKEFAK